MTRVVSRGIALTLVSVAVLAGRADRASGQGNSSGPPGGAAKTYPTPTAQDVQFMSGMISHHAQAIKMAKWAPSHDASQRVRFLCEQIVVAQTDEIALMQKWLRDRKQPVPEADPAGMKMVMNGMDHMMRMPGMLSEAQMTQLDGAKGAEFDRLFLTFMIQHHQGAITMVQTLFGAGDSGMDNTVYTLAADISAEQGAEIEQMRVMLTELPGAGRGGQ